MGIGRRDGSVIRPTGPTAPAAAGSVRRQGQGSLNDELVSDALVRMRRPLTAYEILAVLSPTVRMSPVSVYRALDRLIRDGRVHRIESCSSYVPCTHAHFDNEPNLIAICEQCGRAEEFQVTDAVRNVRASVRAHTFQFASMSLEVRGRCRSCVTAGVDGVL
jgi:Fur family zinc uptake transcriptional regulator